MRAAGLRALALLGAAALFLLMAGATAAQAQDQAASSPLMEKAAASARAALEGQGAVALATDGKPKPDPSTVLPEAPSGVVLGDPATKQAYLEAMKKYYAYRADGYAYRSRVFEWQLFSSRLIFAVVLLLVLAGVYFAAVQFHVALRAIRRPVRQPGGEGTAQGEAGNVLASEFEVSAKGIAVKSSVLGVVVLALSLAFYYLYLVYVYPISNVI